MKERGKQRKIHREILVIDFVTGKIAFLETYGSLHGEIKKKKVKKKLCEYIEKKKDFEYMFLEKIEFIHSRDICITLDNTQMYWRQKVIKYLPNNRMLA